MNSNDKRRVFRALLKGDVCFAPASVSDPLSVRAAEDLGFEVAMLAGSIVSLAVLGAPDIALLSLSELVEQVRRVCRAGNVPLIVDGDHGYGNALNVQRMIEDIEAAGAAAVTVEDTELPAAFAAHRSALISIDEIAGKLHAALEARSDPSFVIVGRTNATLADSREELLARQAALQDAGADAVFVTGVKTEHDLDALAAAAKVPLILGATPEGLSLQQLAARMVRMCLAGHDAYFDGVAAMYRRMQRQRHGETFSEVEPKTLVRQLSRTERYARWAEQFLQ